MNHEYHFDRMNKADRLREQRNVERARKKHEARDRLNEAAPALLEAAKELLFWSRVVDTSEKPTDKEINKMLDAQSLCQAAIAQADKEE